MINTVYSQLLLCPDKCIFQGIQMSHNVMKYNSSYSLVASHEKSFGKRLFSAAMYKLSVIISKYQKRQTAHTELEQIPVDYSNRL